LRIPSPPATQSVEVEPFDLVEVVPAGAACAFDVTIDHTGTIVTTTFYDRDGTPVRRLIRYRSRASPRTVARLADLRRLPP
jgi:hypothetical protein